MKLKPPSVKTSDQLLRVWFHLSFRRRMQLAALLLLMFVVSLAEVVSIGAVLPFLGALTSPESVYEHPAAQGLIQFMGITSADQLLLPLTFCFALAALFSGALRLILHWAQTRLCYAIGADLSIGIYRKTLYQPYAVHLARNSSEIISAVSTKADGVVQSALLPMLGIISSTMMLIAVFSALILVQPGVALSAVIAFSLIYGVIISIAKYRLSVYSLVISREQVALIKVVQEALGGIRDVLIDGTQALYCSIYERADKRKRRAQSNIVIIGTSPRYAVESLGMVVIAVIAYVLASRPNGLGSAIPILGALALGAQRMLPVLQQGYSSWSALQGGRATINDALYFLEQAVSDQMHSASPVPFSQEIRLDQVGFRYSDTQPMVVKDLSLVIRKGSRVGFVGSTGCGKSTLLDIVMGLLIPVKGGLWIDGTPITHQNYRGWQAHIAHVPQSIFLTDATISENIALGVLVSEIDHDRVRRAAQNAQIASTIESWDKQYATVVGERGVRLSGGQRQRIGIARALYKNVDVLIFDEGTSALDVDTEISVMESIKKLDPNLTILMVAHRLSTLRECTQIVELAKGSIKRIGTYEEIVDPSK